MEVVHLDRNCKHVHVCVAVWFWCCLVPDMFCMSFWPTHSTFTMREWFHYSLHSVICICYKMYHFLFDLLFFFCGSLVVGTSFWEGRHLYLREQSSLTQGFALTSMLIYLILILYILFNQKHKFLERDGYSALIIFVYSPYGVSSSYVVTSTLMFRQ